tara:strand:- start:117 stop:413 length:297 start_codon:yes stop_codon:yes gene_type:complete
MTHKVGIYNVDGTQTIRDATAEEVAYMKSLTDDKFGRALDDLRLRRNTLLAETDWWGASDNTMTDAQKKYRQDLRDLTNGLDTVEKVYKVVFPTKPGS